jgi:alkaline phosphatase D
MIPEHTRQSRRSFLSFLARAGIGTLTAGWSMSGVFAHGGAPALVTPDLLRPTIPYGTASGDVTSRSVILWSRTDRPSRLWVEYASDESFTNARRVQGPAALAVDDFTAKIDLTDLPPSQDIFYRITFQDLADPKILSAPAVGHFRTAAVGPRDMVFAWSGDTAGQGWGINPEWGGMKIYEQIRRRNPDFFIHCGDYIYADNPIAAEVSLPDGSIWKNLTIPEKAKVAETLAEFRANYVYNLMDTQVRQFNAEVAQLVQWDDHETTNNWFPGGIIDERNRRYAEYSIKSHDLLAANARRAFLEYCPIRLNPQDPERLYRIFHYGPALDIFMIDERSYRGANTANRQADKSAETAFLGTSQMRWLKQQLLASEATWKLISSDMPLGLQVPDGEGYEAWANGDGPALGRELELSELLHFIKASDIKNVVWITADVHYAAAHYYDPSTAQFTDFNPFWEFVAGPLHAGTFGPNKIDNTFGLQVKFNSIPHGTPPNTPPTAGLQFFGMIKIDGKSNMMTVSLHNLQGERIYRVDLTPDV